MLGAALALVVERITKEKSTEIRDGFTVILLRRTGEQFVDSFEVQVVMAHI